ncbi:MAG: transglycosylase SLT domain-containing protein [Myxococcales bacterium]|nr:transglycosylase SLT domain-containing protein [Myxococcales bacterium]
MIRIKHLSGSLQGKTSASGKQVVRIGRAPDCDVRFDGVKDPKVSSHHAEFLYEDGQWFVVDTGSTNGTLVDGQRIHKVRLRQGEEIQIGAGGPLVKVEFDAQDGLGGSMKTEAVSLEALARYTKKKPASSPNLASTGQMKAIANELRVSADTQTANLAELAAKKIAEERAKAGGVSSGQTMQIMVSSLKEVQQGTKQRTRKKWVKVVAVVAAVSAVVVAAMSVVIVVQNRKIAALVKQKEGIDKEIGKLQAQMDEETDPAKLVELEEKLNSLSGSALKTIETLGKTDKKKAAEVAEKGDDLDREIRDILRKFDAETYAVPPVFKERLKYHIDVLEHSSNLKYIYHRKQKYWPVISKEFGALGLPEEMAYIAWAETQFDPKAKSSVGAAGMWQFTPEKARDFHLRVDQKTDERYDAEKETHAAAQLLANLLAEYGSDSFMLAMASYNRGEAGVRRVLHQVAQEPGGFRKEKRDFWHLYRLKKLPEETREYVPKVLAAAIVSHNAKQLGLEESDD